MNPITTFFNQFKIYIYLGLAIILVYIIFQNQSLKNDLKETSDDLVEQKNINALTIKGYEQTLKIEKEIADENAIALKQKIEVTKTTNKVKEAVMKRGEIKQDEKNNFTIFIL